MASIPLPALSVRAPQQQSDPIQQYGNLLQLRNAMQEQPLRMQLMQNQAQSGQLQLQQQQIALNDQKAMTAAMQQWDGKDLNSLAPLVVRNGGSAQAVIGLKQKALEMQQTYSKIAADDATTGSKNLETMKGKNDMVAGALNAVMQMPDQQISQGLASTAQDLAQKGLIDPQHLQMAQQLAQSGDPNQIRQQLGILQKGLMSQTQQMDAALKQAQTGEAQSTTDKNQWQVQHGGSFTDVNAFVTNWMQAHGLADTPENRLKGQQEYIRENRILPAQATAAAYANLREYPVYDNQTGSTVMATPNAINSQPGRFTVPSYTPGALGAKDTTNYFTSGKGGQQLTAFNTAMDHLKLLDQLSGDLNNSNLQVFNKAAQSWAEQTGNPAPANFAAAKNAMAGEVAAALKTSGATDSEIAKVDQTFDRAQSPMQLKGAIATYRTLLKSKAYNLQQQYQQGMQGKPNFKADEKVLGTTNKPDGVYMMNGQHFRVEGGKVYAATQQ